MRYFSIEDVTFTNGFNKTVTIKDILPNSAKPEMSVKLRIQDGDDLDEIASRNNIYGEDHEMDAFKIFMDNVEEIAFANYDISRLRSLRIPQ